MKLKLTILFIVISTSCFAHSTGVYPGVVKNGISFGSVLAILLSWVRNKSILLAIVHGVFSWLYVIYFAVTRKDSEYN